jgi:nicotinamidase/pyrazinamidase
MGGRTALIAVDVQAGFEPGGNLEVPDGDAVVAPLLLAMGSADEVVLSRDWHPPDHVSFVANGGIWPEHCVQGTPDAEIDLRLLAAAPTATIVSKGTDPEVDAYSAFDGTDAGGTPLARVLRDAEVTRVLVGGLATDYCVRATVLDALREGFEVEVLTDAVRAVDLQPGDGAAALAEMAAAGAELRR